MKRRTLSFALAFFLLLTAFSLVSCQSTPTPPPEDETAPPAQETPVEPEKTPTEKLDVNGDGDVKILALGNSFSVNAFLYLHPVLTEAGVKNLTLGNLVSGSCSLSTVAGYTRGSGFYDAYHKFDTEGVRTVTQKYNLRTALIEEDWDIISIQQVSGQSGILSTYSPHLETIIDFIKANRTVKDGLLVWHMTWAYEADSTYQSFTAYGMDQMRMFNAILDVVDQKILSNEDIDLVIPAGTAIQNARTSSFGDTMTEDGYHLNPPARLVASYAWAVALLQTPITAEEKAPDNVIDLTPEFAEMAKAAANATLEAPYTITEIDL